MTKYLVNRIVRGLLSVVVVVALVMILIYVFSDRNLIFAKDSYYATKTKNNTREIYKYQQWEKYGYLDYVSYAEYMAAITASGEIDEATRAEAVLIEKYSEDDPEVVKQYVEQFTNYYEGKGYTVIRLDAVMLGRKYDNGGRQALFAYKDKPVITRLWKFFSNLIKIDNIHYVEDNYGVELEDTGIKFTLYDPVYNTEAETGEQLKQKFSPAIIGNGTEHKYLLYFDSQFPYIHQNLISIRLGESYSIKQNVDVYKTMIQRQGMTSEVKQSVTYPTGIVRETATNLHTARYSASNSIDTTLFTDNYADMETNYPNKSRLGFSFVIGLIASILAYAVAIPLGIMMARRKDKLLDKIGTGYIIFILACPSLAYIFMVQALGRSMGMPYRFELESENAIMYILPIVSLALPSIAGLMKWLRRYMIDQMNSDYVKFARSGGLSEGEIFRKHIFKNAAIPIVHGIPGSVLGALVGAIITEQIYRIPGAGGFLTDAINAYDNSVIVGLTLFYAVISIISIILGDILMASVDPRISFSSKAR